VSGFEHFYIKVNTVLGFRLEMQSCQPFEGWQDYSQNQIHNSIT